MSDFSTDLEIMPKLTVGNSINLGVYLYRNNFWSYLKLSLISHLWLLVPLYGWIKFYLLSAVITNLSFNNILNHNIPNYQVISQLKKRWLKLFYLGLFNLLFSCFFSFIFAFILSTIILVIVVLILSKGNWNISTTQEMLIGLAIILVYLCFGIVFNAILLLTDLLVINHQEDNILKIIWKNLMITLRNFSYIIFSVFLSLVLTLPVFVLLFLLLSFTYTFTYYIVFKEEIFDDRSIFFFYMILFFVFHIIVYPFWQSLKAVIYYKTQYEYLHFLSKIKIKQYSQS